MGHLPPYVGFYRATEHNIDLFGLAKVRRGLSRGFGAPQNR